MIPKGAEAAERAVANTLRTNLPGMLSQISAAWANDDAADGLVVPLPNPAQVYSGMTNLVREHPSVVVTSTFGRETDDGAPLWGIQQHRLDVVVFCSSDAQAVLDRQLKRYLVAIWEVLKANQDLDGSLSGLAGVATTQYGRSHAYTGAHKPLLEQQAAWEVVVTVAESV